MTHRRCFPLVVPTTEAGMMMPIVQELRVDGQRDAARGGRASACTGKDVSSCMHG